ncbi:MAG: purine-nucleoside phosphorylase [Gammaproteobacteria bacterium]|nr:purine-nucleoside phosphorylase [Gammaproteobacteria bacterium]
MATNSKQGRATRAIKARFPDFKPKIGIILGSGLGGLADHITDPMIIPYDELPEFGTSTVSGHAGRLVMGYLQGVPVACLQGRVHFYEGVEKPVVQILVRTLKLLGCELLLATNAVGSMNMDAGPGSLMMITDHINFQFTNPLVGINDDEFGPRFIGLDHAYDPELRQRMLKIAEQQNITLHQGILIATLGPTFETPAEIRAFMMWGASAVGMSTVPEVIIARHCGLRTVVVSAVTNYAAGLSNTEITHAETLKYAAVASGSMLRLVGNFVGSFANDNPIPIP